MHDATEVTVKLDAIRERAQRVADYFFKGSDVACSQQDVTPLLFALQAVVDLHRPHWGIHPNSIVCQHRHCVDDAFDQMEYPCPTIQAIEKELDRHARRH